MIFDGTAIALVLPRAKLVFKTSLREESVMYLNSRKIYSAIHASIRALLLSSILMSQGAWALPVLRETAGDFSETFVTIYPDHRDKSLYYFMPNQIRFAIDKTTNLPNFSLMTYGIEQADLTSSFGYLSFVMQPAVSDDVKIDLQNFKAKNPNARLAPLPVGESYLTIGSSRLGIPSITAQKIFTGFDLPPFAGLLDTQVGGNGYLTGIGAKILNDAARKGLQIVTLNECFTIDGVTPMMDATVSIDYQRAYEYIKSQASVGWWIFGADVASIVKKLQEDGTIKIELHGDTKFEDVVMDFARSLAKEYLKPSLTIPDSDVTLTNNPFKSVRFAWGNVDVEERRRVSLVFTKQADIQDIRCIAAPLSGIAPYADKLISNTTK